MMRIRSSVVVAICIVMMMLTACGGKPSDMSDADYAKYKDFGAPKLLYSCTEEGKPSEEAYRRCGDLGSSDKIGECLKKEKITPVVNSNFYAGIGPAATYNDILTKAKDKCNGKFDILNKKE
jgi:hypothetical protein